MMGPIYQRTKHTIGDADFSFAKVAPTSGDPTARKLVLTTIGESVEVVFTHEEYALFKAIVSQY
jgi:hypothetical protein